MNSYENIVKTWETQTLPFNVTVSVLDAATSALDAAIPALSAVISVPGIQFPAISVFV